MMTTKKVFLLITFLSLFLCGCSKQTCSYCHEEKHCQEYTILNTTRYICSDCLEHPANHIISSNVFQEYVSESASLSGNSALSSNELISPNRFTASRGQTSQNSPSVNAAGSDSQALSPEGNQEGLSAIPGGNQDGLGAIPGGNQEGLGAIPGGNQEGLSAIPGGNQEGLGAIPGGNQEGLGAIPGGNAGAGSSSASGSDSGSSSSFASGSNSSSGSGSNSSANMSSSSSNVDYNSLISYLNNFYVNHGMQLIPQNSDNTIFSLNTAGNDLGIQYVFTLERGSAPVLSVDTSLSSVSQDYITACVNAIQAYTGLTSPEEAANLFELVRQYGNYYSENSHLYYYDFSATAAQGEPTYRFSVSQ